MTPCHAPTWIARSLFVAALSLALTQPSDAQTPRAAFRVPAPVPAALAPPVAVSASDSDVQPASAPFTVNPLPANVSTASSGLQPGGGGLGPADAAERLRNLELSNKRLSGQVKDLLKRYGTLQGQVRKQPPEDQAVTGPEAFGGSTLRPIRSGVLEPEEEPERGPYVPNMRAVTRYIHADFSNGLRWHSADDFFDLTFHNLTQTEYRAFDPTGDPLHSQFFVPRQRWYFEGKVSDWADYYTVINRGYGSLDLLDAWSDINFDKTKMQLRIGRMKTPFSYEYIKIAENDLIAPERSLFIGNFSTNRQMGAMLHGAVAENRVEYAVGIFNGQRRAFEDYNSGEDFIAFTNTRPFLHWDTMPWLQQLNFSGSYVYGQERNPLSPSALRTANDQSLSAGVETLSPTILAYTTNTIEVGPHMQYSADITYYVRSLGLMAAYQGGYQTYGHTTGTVTSAALTNGIGTFTGATSAKPAAVGIQGFNVTAFYFLTGEEITRRRSLLEPINPFGMHQGHFGLGAIEIYARYANLQLSNNVFTDGFADPTFWTNRAGATDIGFNWYWNHYLKFTFDWQHTMYGSPVWLAPGATTTHENIFWFRSQVFF